MNNPLRNVPSPRSLRPTSTLATTLATKPSPQSIQIAQARAPPRPIRTRRPTRTRGRTIVVYATFALAALLAFAPTANAQDDSIESDCSEAGRNVQCTEFGTIGMDTQRDIRGDPIDLAASIELNTAYTDQGARWVLVSVRSVDPDGSTPVTIDLQGFSSPHGDIVTTRVEQPSAGELNLWVDTLDMPVGTPVALDLSVGATERGAYNIETLVMAFDRGYAPLQDANGEDVSLFSSTLLGVNKETAQVAGDGESMLERRGLPGLGLVPVLAALAAVAAVAIRRRA